jgi:3''-phosphoadenosine 5''-phosphosulfate sulfotransferase (PAPS reductase)/FAD synthetase and related enzymes
MSVERAFELLSLVAHLPIVVCYSGGKDSTVVLDIVGRFAENHDVERVFVVYNDVWLDYPVVRRWVYSHLEHVKLWSKLKRKPFEVLVVTPPKGKDFFTLVFEKGYALPTVRMYAPWCTKEMKTRPTARIIKQRLQELGYSTAVYVTGVRVYESVKRKHSIFKLGVTEPLKKLRIEYLGEVYYLALIFDWTDEDVFNYLKSNKSVYGDSFEPLLDLYKYASNGKLRTGCWVCPLVLKDNFGHTYANVHKEYKVVLKARERLIEISENPMYRTAVKGNYPAGRLNEEGKRKVAEVLCELLKTDVGREIMQDYITNVPTIKDLLVRYGCSEINI